MKLTPERWHQVARIYELAADRDARARDAFLTDACAGDPSLRQEVESLLSQDAALVILDRSVWATAAPLFPDAHNIGRGTTLGPYRIESSSRRRRHGSSLPGHGYTPRSSRGNQGPADRSRTRSADAHPVRARSEGGCGAHAPAHLYPLRRRDVMTRSTSWSWNASRATRWPLDSRRGDCRSTRRLTYANEIAGALDHAHTPRDHPSRPEARQHHVDGGRCKAARFWPREGSSRRIGRCSPDACNARGQRCRRASGSGSDRADGDAAQVTRHGTVLGTIRYMAPEQITGDEVDARSDVFSFGAVAFEMLTGRPAFEGDTVAEVRDAVLEHDPPAVSSLDPEVPSVIDDMVRRCLAKNVNDRFQTVADVIRELQHTCDSIARARAQSPPPTDVPRQLRRWTAGILITALAGFVGWGSLGGFSRWPTRASGQIRSVAVLPLQNLSSDPEQQYFADGMTEQLIADLATTGGLRVIARSSVMQYQNGPEVRARHRAGAAGRRDRRRVSASDRRSGSNHDKTDQRNHRRNHVGPDASSVTCKKSWPSIVRWRERSRAKSMSR